MLTTLCPLSKASNPKYSAHPYLILETERSYPLGKYIEVFEDTTASLSLAQVQAKWHEHAKRFDQDHLSFGITDSAYWIKIAVENRSSTSDWKLVQEFNNIHHMTLYRPDQTSNTYTPYQTGSLVPIEQRELHSHQLLYMLALPANESKVYYLRFESAAPMHINLALKDDSAFHQSALFTSLWSGLLYGSLLVVIAFNTLILLFHFRRHHLWLISFLINFSVAMSIYDGLFVYLLPLASVWTVTKLLPIAATLGVISISLFITNEGFTKITATPITKALFATIALLCLVTLWALITDYSIYAQLFYPLAIICFLLCIVRYRQQSKEFAEEGGEEEAKATSAQRFIFIGLGGFVAGSIIQIAVNLGGIHEGWLAVQGVRTGILFMAICFSISVLEFPTWLRTIKRKTEQALTDSQRQLSAIFNHSTQLILITTRDGKLIELNSTAKAYIAKYSHEPVEFIYDIPPLTQVPELKEKLLSNIEQALAGLPSQMELSFTPKGEKTIWLNAEFTHFFSARNNEPLIVIEASNITTIRQAERDIKRVSQIVASKTDEQLFQSVTEVLYDIFRVDYVFIGLLDSDEASSVTTKVLCAQGKIVPNIQYDLKDTPCTNVMGQKCCVYPTAVQRLFPKDELLKDMNIDSYIGSPIFDQAGKPLGILVMLDSKPLKDRYHVEELMQILCSRLGAELDRLAAKAELERQKKAQSEIIDAIKDAVITIDQKGIIIKFNDIAPAMFGYTPEELLGQNVAVLVPDEHAMHHDQYIKNYMDSGIRRFIGVSRELMAKKLSGELIPVHIMVVELTPDGQGQKRFMGFIRDLSQFKLQEKQLRQSQKMQALGKLTGGIAHDFNNLLGAIQGYCELLQMRAELSEKESKYLKEIQKATLRGANLTKKLLSFSKSKAVQSQPEDLNRLLSDSLDMLKTTLTPSINIWLYLASEPCPVALDKNDFNDAIVNLCINAMHAMKGAGDISITTKHLTLHDDNDARPLNLTPGDYISVIVADNGCGIPAETLERIFEPFYSTKGDDGTGLGLSQVYGFMQRTKGTVQVVSEEGQGSSFILYFPVQSAGEHTEQPTSDSEVKRNIKLHNEKILVVDDEPAYRELCQELLEKRGYRVLIAQSAKQALSILNETSVDAVISDIIMPHMSGYELAQEIIANHPNTKILFMSGYSRIQDQDVGELEELVRNKLLKPFTAQQLWDKLQTLFK